MVELGFVESPPLSEIARLIQKPSPNLYTDLLLAHVGEVKRRAMARETETSEELGIKEFEAFVPQADIIGGDVLFEEGSGLSRNNLTTARDDGCAARLCLAPDVERRVVLRRCQLQESMAPCATG